MGIRIDCSITDAIATWLVKVGKIIAIDNDKCIMRNIVVYPRQCSGLRRGQVEGKDRLGVLCIIGDDTSQEKKDEEERQQSKAHEFTEPFGDKIDNHSDID